MNATFRTLLATVAALVLAIAPQFAAAQQDAGAKIRGDAYWPSRAASRRVEAARNYAQEVQTYLAKTPQPEPSVVKEIKATLGSYLEEAQKHYATMKKDFAADKEAVAAIETLEKELAAAVDHNKAMITCCENQKFDKIATMTCCTDLVKQLDKVYAEHAALMKKLAGPAPAAKK